ncbi:MAG TPA: hypothetical protein VJ546_11100, partial [Bacillales bacterium]|nr:hypothetical protein [Bacillales bacterium]
ITQTFELEYSKEEYNEAEYFLFDSNSYLRSVYEDQPEKCYSLRCPTCKVYIEQNKDLIIKKKTFGAKMISLSWEEELIVSPDVKNLFEESKIENLDFRPVFNNYEEINPIAYQVIATNILPSNDTRTEMRQVISCDSCNFKSFVLTPEHAMYYSKDEINKFHDINRTYEFFGSGFFPRPYLVVSKKVREMVLNNKVKGVTFQPIFFAY